METQYRPQTRHLKYQKRDTKRKNKNVKFVTQKERKKRKIKKDTKNNT